MPDSQCRLCKEEIKPGAKLCRYCSSYQAPWREWLRHSGIALALVSFILSALAYTWNQTAPLRYWLCGTDNLELLSIKTDHKVTFANSGDGKIFVEQLLITSTTPPYSKVLELHEQLSPRSVRTFEIGQQEPASAAVALTAEEWSQILSGHSTDPFVPIFYEPDSPALDILRRNIGTELPTFTAQACIRAQIVWRNEAREFCFELVGAPFKAIDAKPLNEVASPDA